MHCKKKKKQGTYSNLSFGYVYSENLTALSDHILQFNRFYLVYVNLTSFEKHLLNKE